MTNVFTTLMAGLRERQVQRHQADMAKGDAYRRLIVSTADGKKCDPAEADRILLEAGETPESFESDVAIALKRRALRAVIQRYEESNTPEAAKAYAERRQEFIDRRDRTVLDLEAEAREIEADGHRRNNEGYAARDAKTQLRSLLPRRLLSLKREIEELTTRIANESSWMDERERLGCRDALASKTAEFNAAVSHVD